MLRLSTGLSAAVLVGLLTVSCLAQGRDGLPYELTEAALYGPLTSGATCGAAVFVDTCSSSRHGILTSARRRAPSMNPVNAFAAYNRPLPGMPTLQARRSFQTASYSAHLPGQTWNLTAANLSANQLSANDPHVSPMVERYWDRSMARTPTWLADLVDRRSTSNRPTTSNRADTDANAPSRRDDQVKQLNAAVDQFLFSAAAR